MVLLLGVSAPVWVQNLLEPWLAAAQVALVVVLPLILVLVALGLVLAAVVALVVALVAVLEWLGAQPWV